MALLLPLWGFLALSHEVERRFAGFAPGLALLALILVAAVMVMLAVSGLLFLLSWFGYLALLPARWREGAEDALHANMNVTITFGGLYPRMRRRLLRESRRR